MKRSMKMRLTPAHKKKWICRIITLIADIDAWLGHSGSLFTFFNMSLCAKYSAVDDSWRRWKSESLMWVVFWNEAFFYLMKLTLEVSYTVEIIVDQGKGCEISLYQLTNQSPCIKRPSLLGERWDIRCTGWLLYGGPVITKAKQSFCVRFWPFQF